MEMTDDGVMYEQEILTISKNKEKQDVPCVIISIDDEDDAETESKSRGQGQTCDEDIIRAASPDVTIVDSDTESDDQVPRDEDTDTKLLSGDDDDTTGDEAASPPSPDGEWPRGNENDTDSDIEVLTSYEDFMQKREMVRQELENMKELEESQTRVFGTLKRFSLEEKIYPEIRRSKAHTVAFSVQDEFKEDEELTPFPDEFVPTWDPDFVPMPCCDENTCDVRVKVKRRRSSVSEEENSDGERKEVKTFKIINQTLSLWDRLQISLHDPFASCDDLIRRINHFCRTRESGNVLKYAIETLMTADEGYDFFAQVLPMMTELCLDLPNIVTCPLPLLKRHMNSSISLSQKQIACLLANSFFSTFPDKLENRYNYPSVNLIELFSSDDNDERFPSQVHKLRCIIHYFERISKKMPNGVVTFTRKFLLPNKIPDWSKSRKDLSKLVALCNGTIETNGVGMLQVDFANKYVGGGVLGRGAVQEEILFVIYPELLVSRLFTDKLVPNEALLITGCERFSNYRGYTTSFEYAGDFEDSTPRDPKGRRQTQFVAMDALFVRKDSTQFHPKFLERELNKAYVGFSSPAPAPVAVASGKWGCGAFNGNAELKAILQLLAASEAGRDLVFFTFGDTEIQRKIAEMVETIKGRTVGQIFGLLRQFHSLFCPSMDHPPVRTLFDYLSNYVTGHTWDGQKFKALEIYETKLQPLGEPVPVGSSSEPIENASEAGPKPVDGWKESQAALKTLDSFKLTEVDESLNLNVPSPSCGFVIDRTGDPDAIESDDSSEPELLLPETTTAEGPETRESVDQAAQDSALENMECGLPPVPRIDQNGPSPGSGKKSEQASESSDKESQNVPDPGSVVEVEGGLKQGLTDDEYEQVFSKRTPGSWKEWKENECSSSKKRKTEDTRAAR